MKNGKTYTAEEMRKKAKVMLGGLGNGVITMPSQASSRDVAAMLRYAADIKERGDEALTALDDMQNTTEHLDIETVKDIVRHILFGAQGSQSKAEREDK